MPPRSLRSSLRHPILKHIAPLSLCLMLGQSAHADQASEDAPPAEPQTTQESSVATESVVATFRDRLHPQELKQWMGLEASSDEPSEASQELVLLKVLAREAEALGLDREPDLQWRLDREELAIIWPLVHRHALAGAAVDEEKVTELAGRLQTMPRRVRLRNIFKRFPSDADESRKDAIRASMESVVQRWRDGEDFKDLARQESESQTKWQGGLLGNVRPGTLRPTVDRVAMALKPGEISAILEEDEGLTLLYCEKVLDAVVRTPEELQAIARKRLKNQLDGKLTQELEDELLAEAGLVFVWPESPARRPETTGGSSEVVIHWLDGRLTSEDLQAWLGSLGPKGVHLPRERIERQIRGWVIRRMARLRAQRLGLINSSIHRQIALNRLQTLAEQALAKRVAAKFQPITEAEKRQAFNRWIAIPGQELPEAFIFPETFELRIIQLPLSSEDPRPSYEFAESLSRRLRAGELDFASAAERFSVHDSKSQGGRLGHLSNRQVNRRFGFDMSRALHGLQAGEISMPVEEAEALWILRLEGIQPRRPMTFEEAEPRIDQQLGQEQVKRLQQEITDQIWSDLEARDAQGRAID